jgi:hypothetical protein
MRIESHRTPRVRRADPSNLLAGVGVRLEVQLAAAAIGYVGVELGRCQIRVSKHFLNRPKIGAPLEQMRREGVAEEMRVDAPRLEAGGRGEAPQNEECA